MVKHIRASLHPDVAPTGIVRMLSLLASQDSLEQDTVISFLTHSHPRVRERAVLLSETKLNDASVLKAVTLRVGDEDARVRLQAGFSLGLTESEARIGALVKLLRSDGQDQWIRTAALTSLRGDVWQAVEQLVSDSEFLASTGASGVLSEMIDVALRRPDGPDASVAVSAIQAIPNSRTLQRDLLTLMLNLKKDWRQLEEPAALRQGIVQTAAKDLTNPKVSVSARVDAVQAISLSTWTAHGAGLLELLSPTEQPRIQSAAMQTIAAFADVEAANAILERWRELTPAVRRQALSALLNRTQWTRLLLAAIGDDNIGASILSSTDLARLAKHSDQAIRDAAIKLAADADSSTRQQVIANYKPALAMAGDAKRGELVFKKTCSVCHKVGIVGHEVGPNLLSTRNRGTEFILLNVLDPNREVLPAWHDYVAVLKDGRSTNGLVAQESPVSVTLRQSEGKETSLLRADIDLLSDTGRSLMPEDLEKSVSVQQMADLISWLYAQ